MMNNKLPKEQETFNEETISALNEVDEMRKHPGTVSVLYIC